MLFVTIPTYNRAACLKHTLDRILPQLSETALCVVFDNASTDGTPDVVAEAMRRSPFVRSIRNSVNIGGGANFLRCFEIAPEGWIWLLSDDDSPHTDAIRTIEEEISLFPDACYINFATSLLQHWGISRPKSIVTSGITEFVAALDSFGNLLFITAGVHNLGMNRKQLSLTYLEVASLSPQVAMTLNTLSSSPSMKAVQSSRHIATHVGEAPWNWQAVTDGTYRFLHLIPDLGSRARFAKLIFELLPPTPAHGAFRRTLAGLRTSDTILSQDIQRYATLAAAFHRYQWPCMFAVFCQFIAPFGGRRFLQSLHSLLSWRVKRPKTNASTVDPVQSTHQQLRDDNRT